MMQLRPYQAEAKDAILHEWSVGHQRTLLVLTTGCGKTVVFAKVTEEQVKSSREKYGIIALKFNIITQSVGYTVKDKTCQGIVGEKGMG